MILRRLPARLFVRDDGIAHRDGTVIGEKTYTQGGAVERYTKDVLLAWSRARNVSRGIFLTRYK
jgi:hypothetical protein